MDNKNWSLTQIWNQSLLDRESRPAKARDRIWASEIGKSHLDIVLKMRGIEPSNPPNARALRKFEAGNIWEWVVELMLKRAGILQDAQRWVSYQYPGLLEVTGKLDFLAGGNPDFDRAYAELIRLELPDIFMKAGKKIIEHFKKDYPNGLSIKVIEVKSCAAFLYDRYEASQSASRNHKFQLMHYLKAEDLPRGDILYVCKDDCRMLEIPVLNPSVVEAEYRSEIQMITYYVKNNITPPTEKPILYDDEFGKFMKNWQVAYSGYLTAYYGFKTQKDFDDTYLPITERWNRVLGRVIENKKITEKNTTVIREMHAQGFDVEALAARSKEITMEKGAIQ